MIQMSGGDFTMDFDQERTYFKANCMPYDVPDIFNMVVDCALEERSPMAFNIAKTVSQKLHYANAQKLRANPLENSAAVVQSTAYGYRTLGMPLQGFETSLEGLTADAVNNFLQEKVLPSRLVFCANGVRDHNEFVKLVESRVGALPIPSKLNKERTKSGYVGGETRVHHEVPNISVSLCFESVPWNHEDMPVFGVLQNLLGNATGFSMGGPGKGMHCRAVKNSTHIYKSYPLCSLPQTSDGRECHDN